ncbi:hypothetical protein SprV_0802586300 [Sparganum proliferum]
MNTDEISHEKLHAIKKMSKFAPLLECIQPQYSLPLLRYSNESATVDVECAIRLPMCENSEDVVIYGLKETFCEYNAERKTCGRRVVDNEVIIYSTKIEKDVNNNNNNNNKYYPDQYIFCNAAGSHMSMQIVWDLHHDNEEEETSSPASTTTDMMQSQTPLTEIDLHLDDEEATSPSSTTADMMQSQTSLTEIELHDDNNDEEEERSSSSSTTADMMQSETPTAEIDLRDHDEEETLSPSSTTADMMQSQTSLTEIELHNDEEEEEEEESSSSSSTPADMMQSETPTTEIGIDIVSLLLFACIWSKSRNEDQ